MDPEPPVPDEPEPPVPDEPALLLAAESLLPVVVPAPAFVVPLPRLSVR